MHTPLPPWMHRLGLAVVLALAGLAGADRVVTTDGRIIEGTVTREALRVHVDTPFGRVTVPASDVKEVLTSGTESDAGSADPAAPPPPAGPRMPTGPRVSVGPSLVDADRPEPHAFATMRRILLSAQPGGTGSMRQALETYRILAHDGAVRSGRDWLTRPERQRRRAAFTESLQKAEAKVAQADRIVVTDEDRTAADRKARLYAEALAELKIVANAWGDPLLRRYLLGQLALLENRSALAIRTFSDCIRQAPEVAGFYTARARAYQQSGQPLEALADYLAAFRRDPSQPLHYYDLQTAVERTPGAQTRSAVWQQAQQLVQNYTRPDSRDRASRHNVLWPMPGGAWSALPGALPLPAYNGLYVQRALAVPVGEEGTLLVDADAVADAEQLLVELPDGSLVPAWPVRLSSGYRDQAAELPLAAIRTPTARYRPPPLAAEALTRGARLTVWTRGLWPELDTPSPRQTPAEPSPDGTGLSVALLPGEPASPVLTDQGQLVGFLAGRLDIRQEAGGPDRFVPLAELDEYLRQVARSGSLDAPRSASDPLQPRSGPHQAAGEVFTVHILKADRPAAAPRR